MVGTSFFKNMQTKIMFALNNPPVHTLRKSNTPIIGKKDNFLCVFFIIVHIYMSNISFCSVFMLLNPKIMFKRQSD